MFSSMLSASILGVECRTVRVEADVSEGLPVFTMVGFLSAQAKEAQDRVKTAMRNAGYHLPAKRITINLAPGDVRKEGTGFDLPVAVSILASLGYIPGEAIKDVMAIGELSLDGRIRGVQGILAVVLQAKEMGCRVCLVPGENFEEGNQAAGIQVVGIDRLEDAVVYLTSGTIRRTRYFREKKEGKEKREMPDFSEIQGQEGAKRAALIASAGFHNFLMLGPPGVGKSMMAKRICSILPPVDEKECMEISRIYSIAGLLPKDGGLICERPFRSPHHTISAQALAGGGKIPRPGEITLAHRGVLFLDELTEFSSNALEILRQPLEEHRITVSRTGGSYVFPAHFMLVCAMNPCPCGNYPDMKQCTCSPEDISRYVRKLSRPLLDRIDVCVHLERLPYRKVRETGRKMDSDEMRKQAEAARERQRRRFAGTKLRFNGEIPPGLLKKYCPMTGKGEEMLEKAYKKMDFSVRGCHKILKTARTIADLEGKDLLDANHISEAVCYRTIDGKYWK